MEGEHAGDEVDPAAVRRIADLLRPLVLLRGIGEMVVIGRPVKSRSFDGLQSQKRQAEIEVSVPGPICHSARSETPPSSWRAWSVGVEIGQPVERIGARRRIAERGGERRDTGGSSGRWVAPVRT